MATDNTSDISENDIIVAFELKNNSNPLAIYLEYQSKFLLRPDRPSVYLRFQSRGPLTAGFPGFRQIGVYR